MVGLTRGVVAHVIAIVVRAFHLSALIPAALRLKRPEREAAAVVAVLHDGEEYVSTTVVIETCDSESAKAVEYIEAVKLEVVGPAEAVTTKMRNTDECMAATDVSSNSESPLGSLEPDEEVLELSDNEGIAKGISSTHKTLDDSGSSVSPSAINVVALEEKGSRLDLNIAAGEQCGTGKLFVSTFKNVGDSTTTVGSIAVVHEVLVQDSFSSSLILRGNDTEPGKVEGRDEDALSDHASIETNATETSGINRIRELVESTETVEDAVESNTVERGDAGAASKSEWRGATHRHGGLSSASSISSISSEDEASVLRAHTSAPSFLPEFVMASVATATL